VAVDKVWHGSKAAVRKDGSGYEQELVASVVHNHKSEIVNYLVVVRDVTEQKRLRAIAEIANNMNNIGFIFSGVRHELGNPVNSMKVAATILRDDYHSLDDAARLEYVDRMRSDIERLQELLKVLHSFSMFENLTMEEVGITGFFRNLMPAIEPDFKRAGIAIEQRFPEGDCLLLADRRALYQVVVNLLNNAHASLRGRAAPRVTVSGSCDGARFTLAVADNGCGMPEAVRQNLFKPFYTTKPEGTGLGLVICQKLVLAMNGFIEVASAPDQGTAVTVSLPLAPREG
jgi:signal transduction histidine kinase